MESIYELARKLVLIAIFAAFCELLLPRNNFRPYIRMVVGLLVIALVLQPILELRGASLNLDGLLQGGDLFDQGGLTDSIWLQEESKNLVEQELAVQVGEFTKSDYPGYEVRVSLDVSFDQHGSLSDFRGMEVVLLPGPQGVDPVKPVIIGGEDTEDGKCAGPPELVRNLARYLAVPEAKITVWVYSDGGGAHGH